MCIKDLRVNNFLVLTRLITSGLLMVSGVMMPGALISQKDQLHGAITRLLRFERPVDFDRVPGILVGVLDGDSTHILSFGTPLPETGVFEMGSVTKPIVAWMAEQLLLDLGWDHSENLCRFVPDSLCSGALSQLSVSHVLHHRGGLDLLPAGIGYFEQDARDPYAAYSEGALGHDLRSVRTHPGSYSYSHTGYAVLHWLFQKGGGRDTVFNTYCTRPFQFTTMGFSTADSALVTGHGMNGLPHPVWHTASLTTSLGLRSSIGDMLSFLRYTMPELEARHPLFSSRLKQELRFHTRMKTYKVDLGWFMIQSGSTLVYYHNGRTGGHHTSVAFSPHKRKGVVVISNGTLGSGDLSLRVLDMLVRSRTK